MIYILILNKYLLKINKIVLIIYLLNVIFCNVLYYLQKNIHTFIEIYRFDSLINKFLIF